MEDVFGKQEGDEFGSRGPATRAIEYSRLQIWMLARLKHLLDLRRVRDTSLVPQYSKLLDWAIYSTFCDCLEERIGKEARSLLRSGPRSDPN